MCPPGFNGSVCQDGELRVTENTITLFPQINAKSVMLYHKNKDQTTIKYWVFNKTGLDGQKIYINLSIVLYLLF